jgi:nucleoside-diphosphate-sugar epimerase
VNAPSAWSGEGTILFGGSGFLGPSLLRNHPQMISVGRRPPPTRNRHVAIESLTDLRVLDDVEFENVVYIVGNTDHPSLSRPEIPRGEPTAYDYHLTPLLATLEQLKQRPLRRFLHFSTVLLYDERRITLPVDERAPIDPYRNRYVLSKYLAEEACKFFAAWVPIVNIRMSNLYGPTPLERYDLVHTVIRKLLTHRRAQVWTTRPARDFIYVKDAADAIAALLQSDFTGTMTTVRRVVELLEEVSGCPIEDLDQPVTGPEQFCCDTTLLHEIVEWRPRYDIEQGVRETYRVMESGDYG